MKTEISNFFVLVIFFLLGLFLVFWFLFRKQKTVFLKISNRSKKIPPTQERARKKRPESHLGLFSNGLTLNKKKSAVSCPFLLVATGETGLSPQGKDYRQGRNDWPRGEKNPRICALLWTGSQDAMGLDQKLLTKRQGLLPSVASFRNLNKLF